MRNFLSELLVAQKLAIQASTNLESDHDSIARKMRQTKNAGVDTKFSCFGRSEPGMKCTTNYFLK